MIGHYPIQVLIIETIIFHTSASLHSLHFSPPLLLFPSITHWINIQSQKKYFISHPSFSWLDDLILKPTPVDHWFSQDGSFPCLNPHVDSFFKDIYINSLQLLTILLLKDLYRPIYSGLHTFCNPCLRCSWLTFSFKIWHLPIFLS